MKLLRLADSTTGSLVGGKAANLARLLAAGAPVPDGFVLTSNALQHFVAEQEGLPAEVSAAVVDAWTALAPGPLIVRSSAVGEDSEEASFAGQLDSVPNVQTLDDLRAAILRVWESQWSARSLAYQSARGTFLSGMGIVVQRQVDAVLSGVLFTISPSSSSDMLLEYCEGLGEELVSGAADPGRISIARRDLAWTQLAELPARNGSGGFAHDKVIELARQALSIELAFGAPQDIEWTIDTRGKLWIVQSRPITGAPGSGCPGNFESDTPRVLWSNANVNENFPQPISPLLYSVARQGFYHYFRNLGRAFGIAERRLIAMEPALRQIIGVHGARMYYNLTSIHHVLKSAPFGDLLASSFDQFVGAEGAEAGEDAEEPRRTRRSHQVLELAVMAARTTWQYLFFTSRVEEFERTADRFAAETHPARLRAKPAQELLLDLRGFMDIRLNRWKNASLADAGSMVCYGVLQRLLARAFPQEDQQALHNTLLKALPDLVSSVPPVKLWELSRMIRANEPLRDLVAGSTAAEALAQIRTDRRFAEFRGAFEAFLEDWGFRCSAELMLTSPSFQEDPAPVIDLLRSYAAMDGESPVDQLARQAAERATETERVLSVLRGRRLTRWMPLVSQARLVSVVLRATQRCIQLRERARLKQALLYSRLRRIALALGGRLTDDGRLATPDDIFLLTVDEIDLLVSGGEMFPDHVAALVTLRRQAHAALSSTTPPDSLRLCAGDYFTRADPGIDEVSNENVQTELRGVSACGGRTTASAAILLDVTESHRLRAGDVLVTRQTDPGWGPIFPLISGLVIERGGMLSHGAIIAREFGIPSVVGVKDATRLIRHGGSITVDGDRGVVRLAGAAR